MLAGVEEPGEFGLEKKLGQPLREDGRLGFGRSACSSVRIRVPCSVARVRLQEGGMSMTPLRGKRKLFGRTLLVGLLPLEGGRRRSQRKPSSFRGLSVQASRRRAVRDVVSLDEREDCRRGSGSWTDSEEKGRSVSASGERVSTTSIT